MERDIALYGSWQSFGVCAFWLSDAANLLKY